MATTEAAKIKERKHPILQVRDDRILLNLKALKGGYPYIDARLSRWAAESDASWEGDTTKSILPRKERTDNIDFAKRIVTKMSQLVFSTDIIRDGINDEIMKDVTKCGDSLSSTMNEVCKMFLAAGWCWLSVDRTGRAVDEFGNSLSVAERRNNGDRVYWRLWSPLDVVDWKFDNVGLRYVITKETGYIDDDPRIDRVETETFTVWERDRITRYMWQTGEKSKKEPEIKESPNPIGRVNFINVGTPSDDVCGFDSIELSQMVILNLTSCHNEVMCNAAYPQPVWGVNVVTQIAEALGKSNQEAMEVARGLMSPWFEAPDDKGITRYLEIDAAAARIIPDEIDRKWARMTEMQGLAMLNPTTTKMVQSAEAKEIDLLDIGAILSAVAQVIQEAEAKAVEMSSLFDGSFSAWDPVYPDEFKTEIPKDMADALDKVPERPELPEMTRAKLLAWVKVLDSISPIPDDLRQKVVDEIEKARFIDLESMRDVDEDDIEDAPEA